MCHVKTAIDYSKKNVIEAYYYLVERFAPVVYFSALVKLQDHDLAQKTTEEVFFYAYNNIHRYQYKIGFVKWLTIYTNKTCHEIVLGRTPKTMQELQQLTHVPENHKVCLLLKNSHFSTRKIGAMLDTAEHEIDYILNKYPHIHMKNAYLNVDVDKCKKRITNKYRNHHFANYLNNFFLGFVTILLCVYLFFASTPQFFYALIIPFFVAVCICKLYSFISQYIYSKSWQKLTILFAMLTMAIAEPSFWAGVDKQKVNEHDKLTLTILFLGKSSINPPSFSLDNLTLSSQPQTVVTTEVIDGKQIILHRYLYTLSPRKVGPATISEIQCRLQKQVYTQPSITLDVTKNKTAAFPHFFAEMRPQTFQLYMQQICPLALTVYHPYSTKIENILFSLKKSPNYKKVGTQYKVEALERRGPFLYKKTVHHLLVLPLKAGKLNISLKKLQLDTFTTQKENLFDKEFGKDEDFSDDFFRQNPLNENFGAERITLPLKVADVAVNVASLPTSPTNFIGAVGEFSATATWEDFDKLSITLRGKGNLETVENIFLQKNDAFTVKKFESDLIQYLSPKSQQVQRTFFVNLQYLRKGNIAIHPYFCYFQPQKQKYQYIDMDIPPITVTLSALPKSNVMLITLLTVLTGVIMGIFYKFVIRGK
ncbi:BatD family protein [Candidatus Uabimicrobium amorphum]|uniref:Uncharacterized protein n=1 Tax=Uabimicrobium amorphum TaxID=2596890 RepID=A0A5S9IP39_UABAM|nr:BatD family protein [Candidatus Uabimicrobium amorphum]BBM85284.1 hypothetical protein UABAM_03648 [Candidatus Uabimicrobium amorphum]